jgi:hypothetical protein
MDSEVDTKSAQSKRHVTYHTHIHAIYPTHFLPVFNDIEKKAWNEVFCGEKISLAIMRAELC